MHFGSNWLAYGSYQCKIRPLVSARGLVVEEILRLIIIRLLREAIDCEQKSFLKLTLISLIKYLS